MIGFCADIFSGMWDDSKYVEWAAEQYEDKPRFDASLAVKAMNASKTVQELKSHFAAAWKMADKVERDSIKPVYDKRLEQLTEKEPA
jgi:hypothetical protein